MKKQTDIHPIIKNQIKPRNLDHHVTETTYDIVEKQALKLLPAIYTLLLQYSCK
jgi:hypothetical protein